jgi:serpin B
MVSDCIAVNLPRLCQIRRSWNARTLLRRLICVRRLVGILVAGLLAAAGCTASGGRRPPAGTHIGGRIGSAVQLVADVRPVTPRPGAAKPVASAEQRFALALLRQLSSSNTNVTVSPSSLAVALTMLENGAAGTTRQQIATALQTDSLSKAQQNAGWRALVAEWSQAAARDHFALHSANSVWAQQGFPVRRSYLAALGRYFATGVWRADFVRHNAAALKAIDDWTKQQTNGKITKLFKQLDRTTKLVLANAVYFKAKWATTFDKHDTANGPFTTGSGSTATVPMMNNPEVMTPATSTSDYQAVELPYKGGRFAALAIMPTKGSLAAFANSLTPNSLDGIVASLQQQPVDLTMPRFTTTSTLDLPPTLQALGMRDAFSDAADFSPMSPVARKLGLQVGQVVQRDYLSVTEEGTEAAAATGITIIPSAAVQALPIQLDHPFVFLIRDVRTGAVLFASEINDPSAG